MAAKKKAGARKAAGRGRVKARAKKGKKGGRKMARGGKSD